MPAGLAGRPTNACAGRATRGAGRATRGAPRGARGAGAAGGWLLVHGHRDSGLGCAAQAGALGYLAKDAARAQASPGPPDQRPGGGPPDGPPGAGDLTPREAEVLRLIAAGASNREIARALSVSEADGQDPREPDLR